MIIIQPETPSSITSNVTVTETAWTAGTYSQGARRYIADFGLYEVLVASTSDEPSAGAAATPPTWGYLGKINQRAMFSGLLWNKTTRADTIEVSLEYPTSCNAIAFFGLSAANVTVEVEHPTDGVIYSETKAGVDYALLSDWWSYWFGDASLYEEMVFLDLPDTTGSTINLTIDADGGTAACAELICGKQFQIGMEDTADYGFDYGVLDYSRVERDVFGNPIRISRGYSKTARAPMLYPTASGHRLSKLLTPARTVPHVFVGDQSRQETIIYGIVKEWSATLAGPVASMLQLEIEGEQQ